jgi:hypothetical protein
MDGHEKAQADARVKSLVLQNQQLLALYQALLPTSQPFCGSEQQGLQHWQLALHHV